jgi:hypothetical protein
MQQSLCVAGSLVSVTPCSWSEQRKAGNDDGMVGR